MRTTIDIPDPVYRALKEEAAQTGTSVKAIILNRVSPVRPKSRKRVELPILRSGKPGSWKLDNETIAKHVPFP